jgi:hypothetical protein
LWLATLRGLNQDADVEAILATPAILRLREAEATLLRFLPEDVGERALRSNPSAEGGELLAALGRELAERHFVFSLCLSLTGVRRGMEAVVDRLANV